MVHSLSFAILRGDPHPDRGPLAHGFHPITKAEEPDFRTGDNMQRGAGV